MKKTSRVLYARDAFHIGQAALLAWTRDACIALAQSPGCGEITFGDGILEGGTEFLTANSLGKTDADYDISKIRTRFTKETVAPNAPAKQLQELTGDVVTSTAIGQWELITLENAAEWIREEFSRCLRQMKIYQSRAAIPGKVGRVREFIHWTRTIATFEIHLRWGIFTMQQLCLAQDKRIRGPQRVQTSRAITADYYVPFRFNGTHAMRLPNGRPALSEAEWIRRYNERKRKSKKTQRVNRTDKRQLRVPKPKHGRPLHQHWQELLSVKPIERADGPRYSADYEFDVDSLIAEMESEFPFDAVA